jgi:potassium/hydrogen antiporter
VDGINLAILIGGFLFVISIIATLISARLGAPMLLIFLIIGMLAGEEGLVGIQFNNPQAAFLIGSIALVIMAVCVRTRSAFGWHWLRPPCWQLLVWC